MICLIRPPAVEYFRLSTTVTNPPLGLAYIAGALEAAGFRISVIDAVGEDPSRRVRYFCGHLLGLDLDEIAARVPRDSELVGITALFTHEWPAVVRLVELIKRSRPEARVVLGGEHVTALPEFCLLTSEADFLVLGEGEETMVDLASALRSGSALEEVSGLAFRDGKHIFVNRRRARRRAIDDIPWPAWHHFDLRRYHEQRLVFGAWTEDLSVPIIATRGCPYQCTYCSSPNMWTTQWLAREPSRVVDEMEHYVHTLGARSFPFQDLTAIVRKDWIVRFCEEIIRRNLDVLWQLPSGTRSEAIDAEVASLLARSGMASMSYAPESGSEAVRRLIKKRMATDRLFDSLRAARSEGLDVTVFMVIGFPHDRMKHVRESVAFMDRLATIGVSNVSVGFYMALPGTELFYSLFDSGKLRLDRQYFRQTTQNLMLFPARSYCDFMGRSVLAFSKLWMVTRFYRARLRNAIVSSGATRARRSHGASRLLTVLRSASASLWHATRGQFSRRWISESREIEMFAKWDHLYRAVRQRQIAEGRVVGVGLDTASLHRSNFSAILRTAHERATAIPIDGLGEVR